MKRWNLYIVYSNGALRFNIPKVHVLALLAAAVEGGISVAACWCLFVLLLIINALYILCCRFVSLKLHPLAYFVIMDFTGYCHIHFHSIVNKMRKWPYQIVHITLTWIGLWFSSLINLRFCKVWLGSSFSPHALSLDSKDYIDEQRTLWSECAYAQIDQGFLCSLMYNDISPIFSTSYYYAPPPPRRHINFSAGPVGVGVTLSCLYNILWTSGWMLTKVSLIYNWDIAKNWLDFGDLDLISRSQQ